MVAKLSSVAMILCMFTNAGASSVAIGTASARGDLRVDGYAVRGDATLFDGSVVETRQDSAVLRLQKGAEVRLATASRGVLHNDRLVLEQGQGEWAPSGSFLLEANGLKVASSEPNSRGLVSVSAADMVQVAAVTGEFRVTNDEGVLLASVRPGHALSFDIKPANELKAFEGTGTISTENGHIYFTVGGVKYELDSQTPIPAELIGKTATIKGTIDPVIAASGGAVALVNVSKINGEGSNGDTADDGNSSKKKKILVFAAIVGGGVGTAIAIEQTNNSSQPASR